MSLAAVPDDDELCIGGMWQPGRQLRAASGTPVAWVSGRAFGCGLIWADLVGESAESGLQPFLLSGMDGGTALLSNQVAEQIGGPPSGVCRTS